MSTDFLQAPLPVAEDHYTTLEVARILGLAVRSVQLMVDRGDLEAWKTPGGHRRIARDSVQRWRDGERNLHSPANDASTAAGLAPGPGLSQPPDQARRVKVLLIEDSMHFQNLVTLLVRRQFPDVDLQTANDGIAGLIMAGQFQPDVLMVDLLLPGIDGATLLAGLRAYPMFSRLQVLVITSLESGELEPYAFALDGVTVVHKPRLVAELPPLLTQCLQQVTRRG
ncbi:MAG: response regulator [Ferruginibacter sp.]|nr:response regulator [Rhodoferax sp.]